jgi:hypothetical protein
MTTLECGNLIASFGTEDGMWPGSVKIPTAHIAFGLITAGMVTATGMGLGHLGLDHRGF